MVWGMGLMRMCMCVWPHVLAECWWQVWWACACVCVLFLNISQCLSTRGSVISNIWALNMCVPRIVCLLLCLISIWCSFWKSKPEINIWLQAHAKKPWAKSLMTLGLSNVFGWFGRCESLEQKINLVTASCGIAWAGLSHPINYQRRNCFSKLLRGHPRKPIPPSIFPTRQMIQVERWLPDSVMLWPC